MSRDLRVQMVMDRMGYDENPDSFVQGCESEQSALREKLLAAQENLPDVTMPRELKVRLFYSSLLLYHLGFLPHAEYCIL